MIRFVFLLLTLGLAPLSLAQANPDAATSDCTAPVCLVSRERLSLAHVITFDDVRSSLGIGHHMSQ